VPDPALAGKAGRAKMPITNHPTCRCCTHCQHIFLAQTTNRRRPRAGFSPASASFAKASRIFRRELAGGTTDLPLRRYLD
jgi:hypothetical protein